jgi:DNA-binding transcriptional ArsR family regulator
MPALKPTETIDQTLAAVVAHPVRARALGVLAERTASPAELAIALGVEVNKANYHVKKLEEMKLIELVGTRPARGALEHFYRAIVRPLVTEDQYALLSQEERNGFAREICQLGFADAASALATQDFSSRSDNCVARTPVLVDEEGWRELAELHKETVLKTMAIEARSNGRRAESEEPGIHGESLVLFFERAHLNE